MTCSGNISPSTKGKVWLCWASWSNEPLGKSKMSHFCCLDSENWSQLRPRPLNVRWVDTFHVVSGRNREGFKVSTSIGGRVWDPAQSIPNSNINYGCNLYCKQRPLMLTVAMLFWYVLCFHVPSTRHPMLHYFEHCWIISSVQIAIYAERGSFPFRKFRFKQSPRSPPGLISSSQGWPVYAAMEVRWALNPKQPRLTLMMQLYEMLAIYVYVYVLYTYSCLYCICKTRASQTINWRANNKMRYQSELAEW